MKFGDEGGIEEDDAVCSEWNTVKFGDEGGIDDRGIDSSEGNIAKMGDDAAGKDDSDGEREACLCSGEYWITVVSSGRLAAVGREEVVDEVRPVAEETR